LSKSVLTDKFRKLIGASPVEYLTDWRTQVAAQWLKESGMTIDRVAERCSYDSVPASGEAWLRAASSAASSTGDQLRPLHSTEKCKQAVDLPPGAASIKSAEQQRRGES
jgi:transcriptional regulator GlxA family with amidase domain